ncbi:MAG: endonuclease SmrB [Buchnera aphidicola (Brevicoryne brassicae)]|uniref:Ribosome rescue factor SmrB n=1 Tax=Buchnera aphidicola (Brevicoryne brassicae) TaxID=911343 RepID=A0AAJ5PU91_9GAMM|nr:endonuclease SmrB [Buchnera aphidicola]QCI19681.1 endonuclease SmrB [Buchnera aphidicola (Brevicoryne brassicae)]WAI19049.1 MAG: endonuclease SmrB [Buchnera aphidicola (Brevicoryne brassicae)]
MNKNSRYTIDKNILFRQWLNDTREIVQDTIFHSRIHKQNDKHIIFKRNIFEQDAHSHYFSNRNKKDFFKDNPVSYIRNKNSFNILQNLKNGKYNPDIFLDLHGLTQYQAQKALGELITTCQKEKIFCAHVMHGHGKHILKKQIPFWLSQHPDVIAFHQAPKVFGSDAAIIVIIEISV